MTVSPPATAALLARSTCRALEQLGYASLLEFPLANGRRADILALGKSGDLIVVEIKSSVAVPAPTVNGRPIGSSRTGSISLCRTSFRLC
jgi:DNA repair protein MmcB-like